MSLQLRTKKTIYRIPLTRSDGEAVFLLDPDNPEEAKSRLERFTSVERVRGELREKIDWYKMKLDRVVKVISGWEGVEDESGQPLECSRENKIAVYLNNPGIIDELLAEAEELALENSRKAEDALGKSAPGPKRK